jgi:GntR family transcriptional regulator
VAALYQSTADDLRRRIHGKEFGPGAKLPTEQQLMQHYGVSRNTVRLAIAELANQGLVATQPGRGGGVFVQERFMLTYYASRENSPGSENTLEFMQVTLAQGAEPKEEFELSLKEATIDVAERLEIPQGSSVVVRRLVRSANDERVSIQASYYPYDLANGTKIMEPRPVAAGIVQVLAELGHIQVGHRDELTAEMPSRDESTSLNLRRGVPVLKHWRTAYSASRPIRATFTLFAADRNRLVYEDGDTAASNGPEAERHRSDSWD